MARRGLFQAAATCALLVAIPANADDANRKLTPREVARAEQLAYLAARRENEEAAAKPIARLQAVREKLAGATQLVEREDWNELRNTIQLTGPSLSALIKEGGYDKKTELPPLLTKLRAGLLKVDKFAYQQQVSNLPGMPSPYCAPGVVPREGKGACILRESVDTAPLNAAIKEAVANFDAILKACA